MHCRGRGTIIAGGQRSGGGNTATGYEDICRILVEVGLCGIGYRDGLGAGKGISAYILDRPGPFEGIAERTSSRHVRLRKGNRRVRIAVVGKSRSTHSGDAATGNGHICREATKGRGGIIQYENRLGISTRVAAGIGGGPGAVQRVAVGTGPVDTRLGIYHRGGRVAVVGSGDGRHGGDVLTGYGCIGGRPYEYRGHDIAHLDDLGC